MKTSPVSNKTRLGIAAALAGAATTVALLFGGTAFAQEQTPTTPSTEQAAPQGGRGGPFGKGGKGGIGGRGMNAAIVAKALGIDEAALRTELEAGKSVADLASAKGVALDTIVNALIEDQTAQLKTAVAAGTLTQAQADGLIANAKVTLPGHLQTRRVQGLPDHGRGGPGMGERRGGAIIGQATTVAAKALGMTEAELRTELQAGKTIAALAQSKNVALSTVSDALLAEAKTRAAAAVTAGTLTQAQADAMLQQAPAQIENFLNNTKPQRGPGRNRTAPAPSTTTSGPQG
jgi:hypothetical protein